jgi:hypothetical protein
LEEAGCEVLELLLLLPPTLLVRSLVGRLILKFNSKHKIIPASILTPEQKKKREKRQNQTKIFKK